MIGICSISLIFILQPAGIPKEPKHKKGKNKRDNLKITSNQPKVSPADRKMNLDKGMLHDHLSLKLIKALNKIYKSLIKGNKDLKPTQYLYKKRQK